MPGYQTMFRKGAKSLSWASASKKLSKAHNYWLSTIGPNRKPHTMPVWGVWFDQAFYFSTGPRSRKARNIEKNPNCVICPENAEIAIILEGQARKASPNPLLRRVVKNYERKYNWKMQGSEDSFYRVQPMKAFGIVESGASNPTRWSFPRT
ncbi:pyridoxamine 5'-phosphate oxidase family protein [Candidatus Bathyarchaeota archaeon]|nr:pyridoxamine 5'-phosphate oxidase family protein [Candidatus Bathyarchaeota archaeon]